MDINRLQELAGKQACEARCGSNHGQLKLGGFDDDIDWSHDPPPDDSASNISVKPHSTKPERFGQLGLHSMMNERDCNLFS